MNKIITLSGWGQSYDSLASITPDDTNHIDYTKFQDTEQLFDNLSNMNPDIVVGWSLGGQLAMRAISAETIKPKTLILLATPYQFVANKEIKCAMDRDTFNSFYKNFLSDPEKTIKRFITLISLNDSKNHEILAYLRKNANFENPKKWLYWLDQLESFSCNSLNFNNIPPTFALHGQDDTIVDSNQTGLFKPLIQQYNLEILGKCGHAPHMHNPELIQQIIKKHL